MRHPRPLIQIALALALAYAALAVSFWHILHQEKAVLQAWLSLGDCFLFEFLFLLLLLSLLLGWNGVCRYVSAIPRTTKQALGVLLVFAFLSSVFLVPRTNRIYFDEQIYQGIAKAIIHTGRAVDPLIADAEEGDFRIYAAGYSKEPSGYPFYLSLFFRFLGASNWSAHLANYAAYLLGILGVFVLTSLLSSAPGSPLWAALVYMLTPMVLRWSGTAAAEPSAAALSTLALCAAACYAKQPGTASALFFISTAGSAIHYRPESPLVLLPCFALVLLRRPQELRAPRFYWMSFALFLFFLPALVHLSVVMEDNWGSAAGKFSREYFGRNIPVNSVFYFSNKQYPLVFSLLAVLGLIAGPDSRVKPVLILWFVLFFCIFLFFYAGSYSSGADVRFSLLSAAPLAVCAGFGLSWCVERAAVFLRPRQAVSTAALLFLLLQWGSFLPLVRTVGVLSAQARHDVEYARAFSRLLPPNSLVFTHNPTMWHLWDKNAAQPGYALKSKAVAANYVPRYQGGLYFHWNYWCSARDSAQEELCLRVLAAYDAELVSEEHSSGYRFALYRLHPKQ
jgi:hypothetical protein